MKWFFCLFAICVPVASSLHADEIDDFDEQDKRTAINSSSGDILFTVVSRTTGDQWIQETYLMKYDGAKPRRLLAAERGKGDWFPRWASGGKTVVFFSDRAGTDQRRYEMNSDGSHITPFMPNYAKFARAQQEVNTKSLGPLEPDLLPDGTQIVFSHGQDNDADEWHSDLYLINADGSNLRKIPATEMSYQARWSPDGQTIVFDSTKDGGKWHIFLMDADGSNQRRLTHNSATNARPVWSPSGSQIAFHSNQHGGRKLEIYVMDADGSNAKQLTNHLPNENVKGAVHPDWYVRPDVCRRPGF